MKMNLQAEENNATMGHVDSRASQIKTVTYRRWPAVTFHHAYMGYLPFTWENRKFQLEDQLVRAIPFGKPQKIWVMVCGDTIFLLF